MKIKSLILLTSTTLIVTIAIYMFGWQQGQANRSLQLASEAHADQGLDKTTYRDHYYPTTEELASNEMRVIALGTGMPNARMSQAGSCWLVELGNGDTFFFDLGTGCLEKFSVLGVPYGEANKVFLSHLHSDHFGGFASWWMGGLIAGRRVGVEIWGRAAQHPIWALSTRLKQQSNP